MLISVFVISFTLFSSSSLGDSRIVEALDLNGSGFEPEPKMNVLRILNFCHCLYENTKERYAKAKPYGGSLRSVLTKGLPKPVLVRSTTPLIEFKYNKVSGKYEAHSSFKKKKRTAAEADPDLDLKQHMLQSASMMSEDQNQAEQHAYKKKRVSGLPKAHTEAKIHVDLKKSKKKPPTSSVPSKKSASYGNTLETYETDETEEHELRKESPCKNKVFEEDKEDYFTKAEESRKSDKKRSPISSPAKGKDSVTSKDGTVASTNPFTSPIKSAKTTPEKIDTKQQNEKYQNLKITPVHDLNESKTSETSDAQKDTENILNLPKTPTFNLNSKNSLFNNSKSEDSIEQAPEQSETVETKPTSLFSNLPKSAGGLFSNLVKETPVVASENKEILPVSNHNMSFSDEQPQSQPQAQPEPQPQPQVVEPAPVQQQEVKVIPDFLKSYQRTGSISSTTNVDNSNPFLSRAASTVADTSNPFLKPAKTEAPMMSFLNNSVTVTSPQSNQTQTLPTVTSTLGLFSNNNNSTTNNLFGNSGMNFVQNSPAPSLLEINSNSNGGSIFLKSSENSNGFDNSGGNIFHNNFQNDNGMEKESSMGFQNNLFSNKFSNNNSSMNEQKPNNLFGNNFGGNSLFSNNNGMNNNMGNTNSLFASNNSSSQSTNMGMWNNNNSSNDFMNNTNNNQSGNPFLNNNSSSPNSFLSPPQNNKNPFTGGSMGGQQNQQAASNFLGIGANNSPAPQQERVFRKIIMPGSGNKKERAF